MLRNKVQQMVGTAGREQQLDFVIRGRHVDHAQVADAVHEHLFLLRSGERSGCGIESQHGRPDFL